MRRAAHIIADVLIVVAAVLAQSLAALFSAPVTFPGAVAAAKLFAFEI
jgi:hypothetical protein